MHVHHTKNYRRDLLRLEFKAHGGTSGWIEKSGSDKGGNRPDQEGQQKHLSKEDTYNTVVLFPVLFIE